MPSELEAQAEEVIAMWQDDAYDNFKDVILDCRSLLEELPVKAATLRKRVEEVLADATSQARELADEDPSVAEYLKGLL